MIILWEQRNKKIHGENDDDAENLRKEKLIEKAKELQSQQDMTRPSDAFLFPSRFKAFIKESTSTQLSTWITTSRRAITNSINKWKEHKESGVRTVVGWLTTNNPSNSKNFTEFRRSQRKRMEGKQKERRRRRQLADHSPRQVSMNGLITLTRTA